MAVHFILGGSGRGKSYYLNHIVAARAQEEKDKTFIMLVPEQATHAGAARDCADQQQPRDHEY